MFVYIVVYSLLHKPKHVAVAGFSDSEELCLVTIYCYYCA